MAKSKSNQRFDQLLHAMATQPAPSGKPATKARTSASAASASYGDTRTREGIYPKKLIKSDGMYQTRS